MEIEHDAKVKIVDYVCDICGRGTLYCTDTTTMKDDSGDYYTIYTHRCNNCGAMVEIEGFQYPYNRVIPITDIK